MNKPDIARRWTLRALIAISVAASAASGAIAQGSTGPIKFVVPTSPGSSADIGARSVGAAVQEILGRPVIIENRLGAGGSIAASAVAAAEPNGDTIGILGNSYLLFPVEFPQAKFDPQHDVAPVGLISKGGNVLLVSATSPYAELMDLVQAARKQPGKINYASGGMGSSTFHAAERMRLAANVDIVHVPYKGSPEAIREVIAGRVDFAFAPVSVVGPYVQGGKVRALAISSGARSKLLPNVPTTVEAGLPDSSYDTWIVALVPAKTPVAVQEMVNKTFNTALEKPAIRERFETLGIEPAPMPLADLQAFVRKEAVDAARALERSKVR